jgi:RND family efflux transporter MFP subunit
MKWLFGLVLGLIIVVGGGILTVVLFKFGPKPEEKTPEPLVPPVEYVVAEPAPYQLVVRSEGTVVARNEANLIPEVSGRVIALGPDFRDGAFFAAGDELLRIDPVPYEAALAEAKARLAAVKLVLAQEEALRAEAQREWETLGRGEPTELTLRTPQIEKARADLEAARQATAIAQRNLDRTVVRAPFDGRLSRRQVGLGQLVTANATVLGTAYGIEAVEIPVPLSLEEIRFLPPGILHSDAPQTPASVIVEIGEERFVWEGVLDRLEGAVDERSRMVRAVVQVRDPYGRLDSVDTSDPSGRPPLTVGMFARVEIMGRTVETAFELPRAVMVRQHEVDVIDADNRLHRQTVRVLQSSPQHVIITEGLEAGDRLNLTPIDFFIEGMKVAPEDSKEEAEAPEAAA